MKVGTDGIGRRLQLLGAWAMLAGAASAQSLLYVDYRGQPCLVRAAHDASPCVEVDGQLVRVRDERLALRKVEEFLPVFVAVRNVSARCTYVSTNTAQQINNDFHFRADFESGYPLKRVFFLLEMDTERAGKAYFIYEIGRLEPHEVKPIRLTVPLKQGLGSGQFRYRVYVDGVEALHSGIPPIDRELALDRMIARRVAKLPDGHPQAFVGPTPEYPEALRKTGLRGEAVISLTVMMNGATRELAVKSATDPAFGESALAAARLWRFLPQKRDGLPVESKVNLPFVFGPPADADKS